MGLIVQVDDRRARFVLRDEGGDVVPGGPAWEAATDPERGAFWEIVARRLRQRKDEELAAGLDARGEPIAPARWRVGRYAGATGPGMMPFREFSRTRRRFDVAVGREHVTGYWRGDWGRILSYHARGLSGAGRPIVRGRQVVGFIGIKGATTGIVRDVIGLSDAGVAWVVETSRAEWRDLFAPSWPDPGPDDGRGPSAPTRVDALGAIRRILGLNDRRGRGAA